MMKDIATPVPQNEVRAVIKKSLENAALVNYERLSEEARIEAEMKNNQGKNKLRKRENGFSWSNFVEEMVGEVVITPRQKLEDLIRLAELCVDLLRQNEEFYAEVRLE